MFDVQVLVRRQRRLRHLLEGEGGREVLGVGFVHPFLGRLGVHDLQTLKRRAGGHQMYSTHQAVIFNKNLFCCTSLPLASTSQMGSICIIKSLCALF